jgi:alpha-tubulin suppressor-like RCC1 family protein
MFISKGFKFIAGAIIPILVLAQTAMAAPGDFYDTTTSLHYYSAAGLNDTTKAQLTAAYAGGDKFVKERADGTYLDYNGAYALFSQELQGGKSVIDALAAIKADPAVHPTIDTTGFTDASNPVVNHSRAMIASGSDSNTAYYLDSTGHVWAWGSGKYGQLGNGTTTDIQSTPVRVSDLSNIIAIAGCQSDGYALDNSGRVWAWGGGVTGELGNGTTKDSSIPVQVSNLTNIVSIAAGLGNGYALDSSGHVWAWGEESGLGSGIGTGIQSTPVQIPNLTNIVAIAGGNSIVCALDGSGHVWTWGLNLPGLTSLIQIPDLANVVAIAAGPSTDYALDNSGHVWQMSYGISVPPTNVTPISSSTPTQVSNLANIVAIAAGAGPNYALDKSGNVWAWDANNSNPPNQVANLTNIVAIACGISTTYALDSSGHVWAWGWGYYGALGNGTTKDSSAPVQVLNLP